MPRATLVTDMDLPDRPAFSPNEVLALGRGMFSRNSLHRWLQSGKVRSIQPSGKRGRRWIPREEVERLLTGAPRPQRSHLASWHANREAAG